MLATLVLPLASGWSSSVLAQSASGKDSIVESETEYCAVISEPSKGLPKGNIGPFNVSIGYERGVKNAIPASLILSLPSTWKTPVRWRSAALRRSSFQVMEPGDVLVLDLPSGAEGKVIDFAYLMCSAKSTKPSAS